MYSYGMSKFRDLHHVRGYIVFPILLSDNYDHDSMPHVITQKKKKKMTKPPAD